MYTHTTEYYSATRKDSLPFPKEQSVEDWNLLLGHKREWNRLVGYDISIIDPLSRQHYNLK